MGILFPMIIYEGRISLLVNTYLKTIRKEKIILMSNVITLVFSTSAALISIYLFKSINIAVLSIMLSLMFRCILAEILLSNVLNINLIKDNIIEGLLVIFFVMSNLLLNDMLSFLVYGVAFLGYIVVYRRKIIESFRYFLLLMKGK